MQFVRFPTLGEQIKAQLRMKVVVELLLLKFVALTGKLHQAAAVYDMDPAVR